MKAAVLKFIRKLVGVEFRQNADFFSTQLSKVHEYYFKGRALHRKLHFKTNNEVDDNGNYSGTKIWKRSSRRSSIPRWWNCSKKRLSAIRGKLCEQWRSARANHNTLRLIVHYSTHTLIINDDNEPFTHTLWSWSRWCARKIGKIPIPSQRPPWTRGGQVGHTYILHT